MENDQTKLDRSVKHTDTGVALLRISAGIFFLIPGIFKLLMPDDFLAMMVYFPDALQPHLPWLFNLVIGSEIVGGIMLIIGWNIRLAVPALVIITLVAESLVVINDIGSSIRMLSLFAHIMGAGLYSAMFFLGSGSWSIGRGKSVVHWIARQNFGGLSSAAHKVVSGAGKNVGVFLIRASVSVPFIAFFFLGVSDNAYDIVMPANKVLSALFLILALIGGLSLLTGFQIKSVSWMLVALTVIHLVFASIPDISASKIGFINILFRIFTKG